MAGHQMGCQTHGQWAIRTEVNLTPTHTISLCTQDKPYIVHPALGSGQLGSGRRGSGQLGSGQLGSGQLRSGQLGSGQLDS